MLERDWEYTDSNQLMVKGWCAQRYHEYRQYDYCDLFDTTFGLCPDGRGQSTHRFGERSHARDRSGRDPCRQGRDDTAALC